MAVDVSWLRKNSMLCVMVFFSGPELSWGIV